MKVKKIMSMDSVVGGWDPNEESNSHLETLQGRMKLNRLRKMVPQVRESMNK